MWTLKGFISAALICMCTAIEDLHVTGTSPAAVNSTWKETRYPDPRTEHSTWKEMRYPDPRTEHSICHRRRPSFICDPDNLLSWEQADRLDFLLNSVQNTTPCLCYICSADKPSGISIGIFLRKNLTLQERSAVGFSSEALANRLREEWKLGKCEDDIIIVVIAEEKKSAVSLGSTVMNVLPYQAAQLIAKDCDVHFKSNYTYYAQGLNAMVYSFHDILQRSPPRSGTKSARRKKVGIIIGISLGVTVIIILIVSGIILVWRQFQKKKKPKSQNNTISWKKPQDSEPYEYRLCKNEDSSTSYKADGDSSDSDEDQSDNCDFGLEIELQKQGIYSKRQLSDVPEETEDPLPTNTENDAAVLNFPLNRSHSLEVTEL